MITNCFPLSIYREKLGLSQKVRDQISAVIVEQSEGGRKYKMHPSSTWTGDVHGQSTLHMRDECAPMIAGFRHHTVEFLNQLGHSTDAINIYITRCWGTVSHAKQSIATHNHRNSALSIVYYVSVPDGSADLMFYNRHIQNEISPGFVHPDRVRTGNIDPMNALSAMSLPVKIEQDDIVIFPSAAMHGVVPGKQSNPRISVAADTFIVESKISGEEFLLPPISIWQKLA